MAQLALPAANRRQLVRLRPRPAAPPRAVSVAPVPPGAVADSAPRTLHDRVTAAHVRVLEAALEEQVRRVAELSDELAAERARPSADLARIFATVEGLRVAFGRDAVALRLLARIDAALDRLAGPDGPVRVPLPEQPPAQRPDQRPEVVTGSTVGTADSSERDQPVDDADTSDTRPRVEPLPALPQEPEVSKRRRGRR